MCRYVHTPLSRNEYMDLILDNVPNVFECHDAPQSIVVES